MPVSETETLLTETRVELIAGNIVDGKFLIVREINKGGIGTVYEARHLLLEKSVAIKMLQPQSLQEQTKQRFLREAQLTSLLIHPHIVALREFGVWEGTVPYLVMDLLPGRTLDNLIQSGQTRDTAVCLKLAAQIGQAMAYAHERKIIHRDLKPSNVIVGGLEPDQFFARIVDFGIARTLCDGDSALTQTGEIVGTPNYMSPEQATGLVADERSDIYSFGCLLYEVCAGHPPFQGDSIMSVVAQHVHSLPQQSSVDEKSWPLIETCMAKDPANRYQSFQEVVEDIDLLRQGLPLKNSKRKSGVLEQAPRSAEAQADDIVVSWRRLILVFVFIILLLLAASGYSLGTPAWLLGKVAVAVFAGWFAIQDVRYESILRQKLPGQLDFAIKCLIVAAMLAQAPTDFEASTYGTLSNLPDWLAVLSISASLLSSFFLVLLLSLQILIWFLPKRNAIIVMCAILTGLICWKAPLALIPYSGYAIVRERAKETPNVLVRERVFLDAVLFLDPSNADALYDRGTSYTETKNFRLALDDYNRLISLTPKMNSPLSTTCKVRLEDVYRKRARIFEESNEIEKAIADQSEAIRLDPKAAYSYLERAQLYRRQGDSSSERKDLATAIKLNPANEFSNLRLEVLHGEHQRLDARYPQRLWSTVERCCER